MVPKVLGRNAPSKLWRKNWATRPNVIRRGRGKRQEGEEGRGKRMREAQGGPVKPGGMEEGWSRGP